MKRFTAEKFIDERFELGEGPFYDLRFGRFSWVDILGKKIHCLYEDGTREEIDVRQMVGAAIPVKDSEAFLACLEDGLYISSFEESKLLYKLDKEYKSYQRSNDAKADPKGRIWFESSVAVDDLPAEGNLFCYDRGNVSVKRANTFIANGMAWSKDKTKFFFSDSVEHSVFVYDYDDETGAISNAKVLFTVDESIGVPDGLCIDENDNIWLAVWGGSRVECHSSKDGELLAIVEVPAKQSSSCCFGGKNLDTLYITSAGVGLDGDNEGRIFTCKVDVRGVPFDPASRY